ncbi:unnamed protein product [Alopecurus aequalis]
MEGVPAAVWNVLDDDDLLAEVLLRVAFPTTLVCKRWYHHASDREFLRRFRKLHPPRLLGYYRNGRFLAMLPQPPELAAVVQRVASYSLGGAGDVVSVKDCRNGSVYAVLSTEGSGGVTVGVHSPLCPDRAVAIVPPLSHSQHTTFASGILSKEEEQGGLLYMDVSLGWPGETTHFTVHTSATIRLPTLSRLKAALVDNKIYLTGRMENIIVLDLTTSSTSAVQLPQGVDCFSSDIMLSPADDGFGVYLIQVELQLRIWLRRRDNWSLVDTIRFREMVAVLGTSDCTVDVEDTADAQISQVGENAEFVFLKMGRCTLYLDIKCRKLRKVHKRGEHDPSFEHICPFMMIWPPTFPTLKDDFARNAM